MRVYLLALLFAITPCVNAAEGPERDVVGPPAWIAGEVVWVARDGSISNTLTGSVGFPAFQRLNVKVMTRAIPEKWIVSGTILSTNSGGPAEGEGVYTKSKDGRLELVAMANLNGEVLFSVSGRENSEGKWEMPTHLYIGSVPALDPTIFNNSREGGTYRRCPLPRPQ